MQDAASQTRVARIVLAAQAMRALLYGFGAVVLGEALATEGLSTIAVGAIFTAMLAGMAVASLAVGRWADAIGQRRTYAALFVVLGIAGTAFALSSWLPLLLLAALTGTLSTDANESGPITSIEQALLSGVEPGLRARVFGRYNAVAYAGGSFGALAAGGPVVLRHVLPSVPAGQRWLLAFPFVALICLLVIRRLPATVDVPLQYGERGGIVRSRRSVRRLALLFATDAFAGGFVVQSFVVFWFARRYGATVELMGLVFFAVGLLQALSSLAAAPLARRIGLLNTMVFTHLPSNLLLAAIPLMPSLPLALTALLARSALGQMDVPARQAYIAALVDPSERGAAAAYTNSARYAVRPVGPAGAAALMQDVSLAAPFVAAAAIKVVYDLTLLLLFRGTPIEPAGEAAGAG